MPLKGWNCGVRLCFHVMSPLGRHGLNGMNTMWKTPPPGGEDAGTYRAGCCSRLSDETSWPVTPPTISPLQSSESDFWRGGGGENNNKKLKPASEPYLWVNKNIFVSCIINQLSRGVFQTGNLCHSIAPPLELAPVKPDSHPADINIKCRGDQLLSDCSPSSFFAQYPGTHILKSILFILYYSFIVSPAG